MSVLTAPNEVTSCSYRRAVDALRALPGFDARDEAIIERWESGDVSANQAARMLRDQGLTTSATALKDHRRGECICDVAA